MIIHLSDLDLERLNLVADYRVLATKQLMALGVNSEAAVWKWRRAIATRGLVETIPRGYGKSRGQTEKLICLSRSGIYPDWHVLGRFFSAACLKCAVECICEEKSLDSCINYPYNIIRCR
ncbi:MAG: hypothetical protein NTX50_26955 [Candidatus Sumerlaeota bacterium]|nr:hypothetical protein [Candidatus Sumerlaeota bacterium]